MKLHINFTIIETYRLGLLTGFYHSCFFLEKINIRCKTRYYKFEFLNVESSYLKPRPCEKSQNNMNSKFFLTGIQYNNDMVV